MQINESYYFEQGQLVVLLDIPNCISHLFDNPLQYHWNYPTDFDKCLVANVDAKIVKTTLVEVFGNTVVVSFPQNRK